MPLTPRVLERYLTHADRLAAAVVRLHRAGRELEQALADVAESESLTDLGRERVAARVHALLNPGKEMELVMRNLIRLLFIGILTWAICGAGHPKAPRAKDAAAASAMEPCSQAWAQAGRADVVDDVWAYSVDRSPEFVDWVLAVAWVESHMDPAAKSSAGAVGMLQLTPQGALEASLECGLPKLMSKGQLSELLDRRQSIVYGSCLLRKYLRESGGNWASALMLYNGGYRQLANYLGRRQMVAETQDYVRDVFYMRYACSPLAPSHSGGDQ